MPLKDHMSAIFLLMPNPGRRNISSSAMGCFPCFSSMRSMRNKRSMKAEHATSPAKSPATGVRSPASSTPNFGGQRREASPAPAVDVKKIPAQAFTFRELAMATKNFKQESLLGESGFGRVYKGTLKASGQLVAVKQLDRNGMSENKDFLRNVLTLSSLKHSNLVNLVGYCADGDQRLLVYEFLSGGTLEQRLHGENGGEIGSLDWTTRMKIAYGAALGLEYLHTKHDPSIVYRDLKASSILLDEDFGPKLSDIGLEKLDGTSSEKLLAQSMMGMYGYSAPEYTRSNQLTTKSDVYSFGVVLLQLITGRKAVDTTKPHDEQNLVSWAQPLFKDPKKYPDMADPLLKKRFPERDLNQAFAMASMCLQEEPGARPFMSDVVTALGFLSVEVTIPPILAAQANPSEEDDRESSSEEKSFDSLRSGKGGKSHSRSSSSVSSSSDNQNFIESAQETSVYQRKSSRSNISSKSDEISPYGSDDEDIVIHNPKEFTSFSYENSAKWAHIDDART